MERVLEYVKGFLTLYLLIKVLLFLTPKKVFSKYISFFSGVVLALGLLYPVMQLFSVEESWESSVQKYSLEEEQLERSLNAGYLWEDGIMFYQNQVEVLIEKEVGEQIEKAGFQAKEISVKLSESYEIEELELRITGGSREAYAMLKEHMLGEYQLSEEQCEMIYE